MPGEDPWIDVSVPLVNGMVHWPDNTPFTISTERDEAEGVAVSSLNLGAHTGTHMDAPVHFLPGTQGMEALPLEAVLGPARVLALDTEGPIRPAHLEPEDIRSGERLLFRTRNSDRPWWREPFDEDFVHLSAEACSYLAARRVRTVGVDYLSVGGRESHVALLEGGIWIVEGLNLSAVDPGGYELICLPLAIPGSDGAPARALLRRLDGRPIAGTGRATP